MMLREPWRTRLLFVSFAVNLILIPIAAARFWTHRPPLTPGLPRTEIVIEHMVRDLSPLDATRFRNTMEERSGDIEAARVRMLAARGAMSRAIGRSPYDEAAVQAAMRTWRSSWDDWSETLGQAMLSALPGLSDQGRSTLSRSGHRGRPQ